MNPFGVQFGRLVRDKRGIEDLSQDDLAEKSGVLKSRISELENGKIKNPQIRTVDALCVALDISQDERATCHPTPRSSLPPRLLEKLAHHFGRDMPDATEEELEAFLMTKAEEFQEMRGRLKKLADTEGQISELVNAANEALGAGEFETADGLLKAAEAVQLQSSTIVALTKQAQLRIERGNAALVHGDIATAADHFERSSRYFSGIDAALEANNRHECTDLLRYYGYRYKNHKALYAARDALHKNLGTWQKENHAEEWCRTKNSLGGVSWRLSQFDVPEKSMNHLIEAKRHYEDARTICSEEFLPEKFGTLTVNLANIYSDHRLAESAEEYEENLHRALALQMSALRFISKSNNPTGWGIVQHNLGRSYIQLSNIRKDEAKSAADIENAIRHAELSFEVRNPEDSLQYWIASCRTLGEALLNMSEYSITNDAIGYRSRALQVLSGVTAQVSSSEHPHQWAEVQEQLARLKL